MLAIIYSYNLEWPSGFVEIFSAAEPAAEAPQQFISFDCFLDERTPENPDANILPLFYWRVIIMASIPVLIIITGVMFWTFAYKSSEKQAKNEDERDYEMRMFELKKQKEARINATLLIILIFVHPSLLDVFFEMLN